LYDQKEDKIIVEEKGNKLGQKRLRDESSDSDGSEEPVWDLKDKLWLIWKWKREELETPSAA